MNIFFIDESSTPLAKEKLQEDNKYFILSGLVIPEEYWKELNNTFQSILKQYKVKGEIKWRYFSMNKDCQTSISHLSKEEKSELRFKLLKIIGSKTYLTSISVICNMQEMYNIMATTPMGIYEKCYKVLLERFQYCLQDKEKCTNKQELGIIICDNRDRKEDKHLRETHHHILNKEMDYNSDFNNIIGTVFFAPSDKSMGIQLVDLIAGAIYRYVARADNKFYDCIKTVVRRNQSGNAIGWGIICIPHK